MSKFLVNSGLAHVTLNNGRQYIKRNTYLEVSDEVANSTEVVDAMLRKWISISDTVPTEEQLNVLAAPVIVPEITVKDVGTTDFPSKAPVPEKIALEAVIEVEDVKPTKPSKKVAQLTNV